MSERRKITAKAAKSAKPRNLATKTQRHKGPQTLTDAARLMREAAQSIPGADAEYLLMHLRHVPRHGLYVGTEVTTRIAGRFRRLVARARAGEPVQYLVRSAPFLDFEVHVDHRVLIPRPETEELVARALARVRSGRKLSIVDYGTGSGCIAIALARALPGARALAVDASKSALAVAARNVARYCLAGRIRLAQARAFDQPVLVRLRGRVDLLIANPPYIPSPRLAWLDDVVRREPRLALDGGPKGANIVAMVLTHGPGLLKRGGLLAIEIDATHEAVVRRLAPDAEVERDLAGRVRYAFLTR